MSDKLLGHSSIASPQPQIDILRYGQKIQSQKRQRQKEKETERKRE